MIRSIIFLRRHWTLLLSSSVEVSAHHAFGGLNLTLTGLDIERTGDQG